MSTQQIIGFRDLNGLVAWLKVALGALALASLFMAVSSWLQIILLENAQSGTEIPEAAATANDSREALSGVLYLVTYLATAVLFLRWTYLTKKNAISLGAKGLDFSPAMSVGHYFIPILTLWKPYQAIKETFRASHPHFRDNWKAAPHPALLPVWWTIWIAGNVVGQVMWNMSLKAETIQELLNVSWISFFSGLSDLVLVAVVWVLISTLQAWQTAKFNSIS